MSSDNGTGSTEDPKYYALCLLIIPTLTVFGNCVVVISVVRERGLQTVTNFCICSLAVSDFFVATFVMPFAVYVEVVGHWFLGLTACDVYLSFDVLGSTASILNLVAICVDRYFAVTKPWSYSRRNKTRAAATIATVWSLAITVSLPIVFGFNKPSSSNGTSTEMNITDCEFYNPIFTIASSCISFFLPCVIMVVLYSIVFKRLMDRQKALEHLGVKHGKRKHNVSDTKSSYQTDRFDGITTLNSSDDLNSNYQQKPPRLDPPKIRFGFRKKREASPAGARWRGHLDHPGTSSDSQLDEVPSREIHQVLSPLSHDQEDIPFIDNNKNELDRPARQSPLVERLQIDYAHGVELSPNQGNHVTMGPNRVRRFMKSLSFQGLKSRRHSGPGCPREGRCSKLERRENKERKATITLAVVVGVFLACFLPFFTCHVIEAVCKLKGTTCIDFFVFFITTWVGYMNSFMNPIIYTIFNPDFRKAFNRLLCKRSHRTFG